MTKDADRFVFEVEAAEAYDGGLINWLEDVLNDNGVSGEVAENLLTVAAEAEANVLEHAYGGEKTPQKKYFRVELDLVSKGVKLVFRDKGKPFDPLEQPPVPEEPLEEGGRGICLIRSLADEVEYRWSDGENVLSVFFSS